MRAGLLRDRLRRRVDVVVAAHALRRLRGPISQDHGFGRGTPIDRRYIEAFLSTHAGDVRGAVLEVKDPAYARHFGGDRTTRIDVIDIDPGPSITFVADLDVAGSLPARSYDCIILTQVLQFLSPEHALPNLYEALAPGGVLLVSAPCLSRLEAPDGDLWRLTAPGLERLLRTHLPEGVDLRTEQHGNAPAAAAFILGLAIEDVGEDLLAEDDWRFPVVSLGRVRRPAR